MAVYEVIASTAWHAGDGTVQPVGTVENRILWDGVMAWTAPAGFQAVPDTGKAIYNPGTTISTGTVAV
jgi:hypothetical protein